MDATQVINEIEISKKKTKHKVESDFPTEYVKIINYINEIRVNQKPKISQEQIAKNLDMSFVMINNYFKLKYSMPFDTLIKICNMLGIQMKDIIKLIE